MSERPEVAESRGRPAKCALRTARREGQWQDAQRRKGFRRAGGAFICVLCYMGWEHMGVCTQASCFR